MSVLTETDNQIIDAALTIVRRRLKRRSTTFTSPNLARKLVALELQGEFAEVFCCAWLDNRHRLLEFKRHFFGTIDGASVHPRELVRHALLLNAAAVILIHNHPSGVAEPSNADRALTRRLTDAFNLVGVRVLDHLVVGDDVVSFAEKGYL